MSEYNCGSHHVSDLDLIIKILREEVQASNNKVPALELNEQTMVDGKSVDLIAPIKRKMVKNPSTGFMELKKGREIAVPFVGRYKLNNKRTPDGTVDGDEVVPVKSGEHENRVKGAFNPAQDTRYREIKKELGVRDPMGSASQRGKSKVGLGAIKNKEQRIKDLAKTNLPST